MKIKKFLVIILVLVMVFFLVGCDDEKIGRGEKIVWNDIILGDVLADPPNNKGQIRSNTTDEFWIVIYNVSDKQFNDYVEACKEIGFTVDSEYNSYSYNAYNAEGYKLSLSHYGGDKEMSIQLEDPMEMTTITWPIGAAGKQLPIPKSTTGKFSFENYDSFFVYVGNTSRADYIEYVNACSEKGFYVDYSKGDDYYYADNSEGWHVSIRYEGNKIMSIRIDAPSEEDNNDTTTPSIDLPTQTFEPDTTEKETDEDSSNAEGVDPDFKAAMDSYEKFMEEYVIFMKKYKANPSDSNLIIKYADYMSKYVDFVEDFEKWNDQEMNAAETAYYIDVQARVNKKLLEVAN